MGLSPERRLVVKNTFLEIVENKHRPRCFTDSQLESPQLGNQTQQPLGDGDDDIADFEAALSDVVVPAFPGLENSPVNTNSSGDEYFGSQVNGWEKVDGCWVQTAANQPETTEVPRPSRSHIAIDLESAVAASGASWPSEKVAAKHPALPLQPTGQAAHMSSFHGSLAAAVEALAGAQSPYAPSGHHGGLTSSAAEALSASHASRRFSGGLASTVPVPAAAPAQYASSSRAAHLASAVPEPPSAPYALGGHYAVAGTMPAVSSNPYAPSSLPSGNTPTRAAPTPPSAPYAPGSLPANPTSAVEASAAASAAASAPSSMMDLSRFLAPTAPSGSYAPGALPGSLASAVEAPAGASAPSMDMSRCPAPWGSPMHLWMVVQAAAVRGGSNDQMGQLPWEATAASSAGGGLPGENLASRAAIAATGPPTLGAGPRGPAHDGSIQPGPTGPAHQGPGQRQMMNLIANDALPSGSQAQNAGRLLAPARGSGSQELARPTATRGLKNKAQPKQPSAAEWPSPGGKGKAVHEAPVSPPPMTLAETPGTSSSVGNVSGLTTVMLRNLPNRYTRAMLLQMLDEEGFGGKYDFVYLPIDFKTHNGLGYAFVDLLLPEDAERLRTHFEGFSRWCMQSDKVCTVSWSHPEQQGLSAHVNRYRNSPIMHVSVSDEWKPVVFQGGQRVPFPPPTKKLRLPHVRQLPRDL